MAGFEGEEVEDLGGVPQGTVERWETSEIGWECRVERVERWARAVVKSLVLKEVSQESMRAFQV